MASAQLHAAKTRTCSGRQRPADGLQREGPREGRMRACSAGAARQRARDLGRLPSVGPQVFTPGSLSQKGIRDGGKKRAPREFASCSVSRALHPFPRARAPLSPLRTAHMSVDELKTALRETLDRRGILGTMRAHLQSEIFSAIDSQVQGPAALPARWSHDSTCHGPGRTTHAPCCLTRT